MKKGSQRLWERLREGDRGGKERRCRKETEEEGCNIL
jgi:hypothetical protein